jgi:quercetin dioxygenase-like cupin family protein
MDKPKATTYTWGTEIVWATNPNYSGRIFVIKEGDSLPLGYHKLHDKTIYVLQGLVQLKLERQSKLLQEGETYHLPAKVIHQLAALQGDATILECGTALLDDFVEVKL